MINLRRSVQKLANMIGPTSLNVAFWSVPSEESACAKATGVDRWGTGGGGRVPPLFSVGGQHRNPPPFFSSEQLRGI